MLIRSCARSKSGSPYTPRAAPAVLEVFQSGSRSRAKWVDQSNGFGLPSTVFRSIHVFSRRSCRADGQVAGSAGQFRFCASDDSTAPTATRQERAGPYARDAANMPEGRNEKVGQTMQHGQPTGLNPQKPLQYI
jgi:hypothetical protein